MTKSNFDSYLIIDNLLNRKPHCFNIDITSRELVFEWWGINNNKLSIYIDIEDELIHSYQIIGDNYINMDIIENTIINILDIEILFDWLN